MSDSAFQAELLNSLGRLARGLSALFWGLPIALVMGIQTVKTDWLRPWGIVPPALAFGLLFYGLLQLGHFARQERAWRNALERAKLLGLANLGLSPFLFWWRQLPQLTYYTVMISVLAISSLVFLFALNQVLQRLAAMLPDETLRQETKVFTSLNLYILLVTIVITALLLVLIHIQGLPRLAILMAVIQNQANLWFLVFLVLLPMATTMALIWKTKETILASVFTSGH